MGAPNSLSLLFISARLNLVQLAKYSIASKVKIPGMSPLTVSIQPITAMPDLSGWNAIHIAADSESVEMLEWLLTKGADADTQTVGAIHPGCTALHFAAMKRGDAGPRMVTALLDRGANPNFRTMLGGNTPLHYAVNGSPVNTERLLLHPKNRANPNIANSSGITALHKAAAVPGLHAIVEELLKHGADPEQKTTTGLISAVRGLTNITASFASNGSWDIACGIVTAQTPLHIAAKAVGTERTMEVLLRKGAKPDTTDSEGQTPLHVALQSIDYEIHTELLVKSGAAVNVRDKSGRTPLCLFMQKICQTLVGTPQGSQKPFLSAYDNVASLERILGTLLDAGADPLETDNDGKSATDYAMQAGIEWAVRKLGNVAPRRIEKLPIMLTLAASEPEPKLQRRFTELSSTVKKQGFRLTRGRP
jgi:ankyrin repeat protein